MLLNRIEIKQKAKNLYMEISTLCMAVYLIYSVIMILLTILTAGFGTLFFGPSLCIGVDIFYLAVLRREELHFSDLFKGFQQYLQSLLVKLLTWMFTFLWSLLLIVPGIIKGISYSLAGFLAVDYPEMEAMDCIRLSKEMTEGHKMEIFMLDLSFIGWELLSLFTLNLLHVLYVAPYRELAHAEIYAQLKREAIANGTFNEKKALRGW